MKTYLILKVGILINVLVFSSCSQSVVAQGNLVINGGFDAISNGTNFDNLVLSTSAYALTKTGNPKPSLELVSTSQADQTINGLTPGMVYTVSGDYLSAQFSGISFGVTMDGNTMFKITESNNLNWQSFNFSYTDTSFSANLSIYLSANSANTEILVDNIAMYPVPEPASLGLIGLGGIAGATFFRNQKKR